MWSYSENIWPNAQRNWPNARAFDEFRSHLVTVGRIDQMCSSFGQTCSAVGQMCAHLTNFVRIWSLLVGLTKCAAHLAKRARSLPNVAHLVKCRAFDNWSNALRICPNAQIVKCALQRLQTTTTLQYST